METKKKSVRREREAELGGTQDGRRPTGVPLMGPAAQAGLRKKQTTERLRDLVAAPDAFLDDPLFGALAKAMNIEKTVHAVAVADKAGEHTAYAPWRMWGSDLDRAAIDQMRNPCRLPRWARHGNRIPLNSGSG